MSEFPEPYSYPGYPHGLSYPWSYPHVSEKERDRRWRNIRNAMKNHKLDCLITGGSRNSFYLTKYYPHASPVDPLVVFPLKGEPLLWVPALIGPQFVHIATEVSWLNERNIVGSLDPTDVIVNKITQLNLEQGTIGEVGLQRSVSPQIYNGLHKRLPDLRFQDAMNVWSEAQDEVGRSEEDLLMLRKASELNDLSFYAVLDALRPGVKECELWSVAGQAIVNNGGNYPHFMLATSGRKPNLPRAPPSQNPLFPGDVIIFEINANYGGYVPQICYAISLGEPDKEVKAMFDFCEELYNFYVAEVEKQEKPYPEITKEVWRRIKAAGYLPMTPQMHWFGLSGRVPNRKPKPGDWFCLHPCVCNQTFSAGAKFGDSLLVGTDGKIEYLNKIPHKLVIKK